MKTRLASALVLVAALSVLASAPVSAASPATAYRVSSVEKYGVPSIVPGDSIDKVRCYLGRPDDKLGDKTWVYHDFNPSHDRAKQDACSTVLITFSQGRISEIRGVNAAALAIIHAQFVTKPNAPTLVATAK